MLFQTGSNLCLLWNTKEDILKNVGNQTVDGHFARDIMTLWFAEK